jgi:SAM-dependent methyltransferase
MRTLCQGTDRLFATTDRSFLVVECLECKLIRLYPWPDPRDVARYYPETYWYDPGAERADQFADIWRRLVLRDHLRFVRRALDYCGLDLPVLDVGCGGGLFLRELGLPQDRIAGLDFSVNAASVAWNTNGVPAACASLPRAPFRPRSFAAITMFHVLEHLYDPIAYLQAAKELLHPDGRLIVQVPNADCWQFLLLGERWNGLDIPRHLIDFRRKDMESLLDYCGFEVVRRKHFSLRDNPAGLASSLAPGLDPMSRRVRGVPDGPKTKLFKDLVYFALVLAAIPFTLIEAACGAGSTIMLEARIKPAK